MKTSQAAYPGPRHLAPRQRSAFNKSLIGVPIVLATTMAMTLNLTSPIDADAASKRPVKDETSPFSAAIRSALVKAGIAAQAKDATPAGAYALAASTPSTYRVQPGDTVSAIAGRYGLSTASVLALNGLGWSSLIFPGQVLKLVKGKTAPTPPKTETAPTGTTKYTIVSGDTVSKIAARFKVSVDSVLSANGLSWTSIIYPGQKLTIPGATAPASTPKPPVVIPDPPKDETPPPPKTSVKYTIVSGDTVIRIAARFGVSVQAVLDANGLTRSSIIYTGHTLIIPGTAATPPKDETPPAPQPPAEEPPAEEPPVEEPPAEEPPVEEAPATPMNSYIIQSGDTLIRIAAKFGVSLDSILEANGLTRSSIIYTGRTLTIPGAIITPAGSAGVLLLNDAMTENAKIIIQVGRSLGVSDYGLVVALAAAMQESGLRNIDYGDRDSVGLFQQRPSTGWGTVEQIMDPVYAATVFFGGPTNPNKPKTRGLLDIPGWESMTVTQAAQAVQISAFPDAYARWEASARAWVADLGAGA